MAWKTFLAALVVCFYRKQQLKQSGTQRNFAFLAIHWVCYIQFRDCKWGCVWRGIWIRILWGNVLWSVPEKTESGSWLHHISIIWFAILNIQILQLLISPFSEIKSCGAVPTFYIKIIKRRTNQSCSLNQSIKKEHFFYFRPTELIQVGQSPLPPPPHPPPPSHLATPLIFISNFSMNNLLD